MSLHADQQSSLPQGGHELAHIGRIRLNDLCQLVTGQVAVWVQSDKSQNMNSIAKAGRIFHSLISFFALMLFLL